MERHSKEGDPSRNQIISIVNDFTSRIIGSLFQLVQTQTTAALYYTILYTFVYYRKLANIRRGHIFVLKHFFYGLIHGRASIWGGGGGGGLYMDLVLASY